VGYVSSENSGIETPASWGVPGPGETTIASGSSALMPLTSMASFRRTTGSAISPTYWTRLYAKES
jgi:hypothetical protein